MPVSVSYPGLYIEELPSSSHSITAAPTSITVFVGYGHPFQGECKRDNRWRQAIRIFNFTEYEKIFGGLFRSGFLDTNLPYAVNEFFNNGGSDAYVVALEPKYFDRSLVTPAPAEPIGAAAGNLAGITFTARQLTDVSPMTITITGARPSTPTGTVDDMADLLITFGSQVEAYHGVKVSAADPTTLGNELDFIVNRLKPSVLVEIKPQTGTRFPNRYDLTAGAKLTLSAMPGPSFGSWTTSRTGDYHDVLEPDSSLDKVEIFNLLALPGKVDSGVWAAALKFCHDKRAFLILDPPTDVSADGAGGLVPRTIQEFVESGTVPVAYPNAALYFPYLVSSDPLTGDILHLPPSGFVAGIYARTDTNRGVWKAPAGLETTISDTTGVVDEGKMTDQRQGPLNKIGVNVLRGFPGSGTVVWGARTTVTDALAFRQWRYVPVRRTALFIEQTLLRNLGWVVFEPNDEPLWTAIRSSIDAFMLSLFRQGAFQGSSPSQAFLVRCDSTTTTQTDIDEGIVNILVGFRPLKPAEFVIIKIAQLAGQVQA